MADTTQGKIIADLHFHSKYSRAVSRQMELPIIHSWAKKKGIDLLITADFTHPLWIREAEMSLKEVREGIYQLKNQPQEKAPLFIVGGEISSIYQQGGRVHRIHNLVLTPGLSTARKIIKRLEEKGFKLQSDGRPVINLTGEELLELVLQENENCLVIPCHVWTPWFSLYGSMSGFNSIKECFGKYADYITAIETGLSSDPAMNWQIKELDSRQIVSFSDAHSPSKLGREATILNSKSKTKNDFTFSDLTMALLGNKKGDWKIASTIEFYPEEGKYHYSGHRNCNIRRSPQETKKLGSVCPVCGKPLTIGVLHRVQDLASRPITPRRKLVEGITVNYHPQNLHPPYINLVPLDEIIAESLNLKTGTKAVSSTYDAMTKSLGSEFDILLKIPIEIISSKFGEKIGEGIKRVRKQELAIDPGYDGVYGQVKIWQKPDRQLEERQMGLF
jgi:uncharacterized protein (TIGR00375 family)